MFVTPLAIQHLVADDDQAKGDGIAEVMAIVGLMLRNRLSRHDSRSL
jgi:hypothetical protein